jgi:crossover junction endodeoxyribonuclease RuvC
MIVLGIDPGLANCGFGVVTRRGSALAALDGGVLTTPASAEPAARLARLQREVEALLEEHAPDCVAMESLYFGTNAKSAFAVGQARGAVLAAAGARGLDCVDYTPQQVKGAVCGAGGADKGQVARMVQVLLRLPELPAPDHASDALAVAITHLNFAPVRAAVRATDVRASRSRPTGATTPREPLAAGRPDRPPPGSVPLVPAAAARSLPAGARP